MITLEEYNNKLNKLGELNNRITISLGLEHYLSSFSANISAYEVLVLRFSCFN